MEILSAFILTFIADMGDNATMTLSMKYTSPIVVLTGTI
jgi:putative Ca2+/H+ antiporter (TMEM165/GDT1 family)